MTGYKKGNIPWNKGIKNCFSNETLLKMSNTRKGNFTGINSSQWKGGEYINDDGYVKILSHNHPNKDCRGYVLEHRLIMEKHIGRYLKREEHVHHKGIKYSCGSIKNKQDNRIENLELFANHTEHRQHETSFKKLNKKKVIKIKKLAKIPITHRKIAEMFNVSIACIRGVIYNYNWKWVK